MAARGNCAFANDWQWLVGIPALAAIVYLGDHLLGKGTVKFLSSNTVLGTFVAALIAFAITWAVAFLVRLVSAPVSLISDAELTIARLASELASRNEKPSFLTLREASAILYGELRGTSAAKIAEQRIDGTPDSQDKILDAMGNMLARNAPLQVRKAPSPAWEDFNRNLLSQMRVCGGATGIKYLGKRMPPYFTDVRILVTALQAAVDGIKMNVTSIPQPSENDDDEDDISGSPLVIIFDPANSARKFWSIEPIRDKDGAQTRGSFWEYRAIVKNTSNKTVRNVQVTTEAIGPLPKRPEVAPFDIDKTTARDLRPGEEVLVPIWRWFNPVRVAGMVTGADAYGPLKATASGDDVCAAAKLFHVDPERTPALWE